MIALTFHEVESSIKYQNFWLKGNKNTICFDWYRYFIWLSRALMNNSEDDVYLVGPTEFNYGTTDELKLVNKRFYVEDFTQSFRCDQICFSYPATHRKFRGALITRIANTPVFTKAKVVTELSELQQQGCKEEFSLAMLLLIFVLLYFGLHGIGGTNKFDKIELLLYFGLHGIGGRNEFDKK